MTPPTERDPVSLAPLDPIEALRALLAVDPTDPDQVSDDSPVE